MRGELLRRMRFVGDPSGRLSFLSELIGWVGDAIVGEERCDMLTVRTGERTVTAPMECWEESTVTWTGLPHQHEEHWARASRRHGWGVRLEMYVEAAARGRRDGRPLDEALREFRARVEEVDREYA